MKLPDNYRKKTDNMVVDPWTIDLLATYPVLRGLIEKLSTFDPTTDKDPIALKDPNKVFRYLSLCYDPQSPMVREYPDMRQRKKQAKEITELQEKVPVEATILFLKNVISNKLWTVIVAHETAFDEYTDKVMHEVQIPDDPNELLKTVEIKGKLLSGMTDILARTKTLYADLYAHDEELLKVEGIELTPEAVANAMSKNKKR